MSLLKEKEIRDVLVSRVDLLDEVKKLDTIGDTGLVTTSQVGEFYEVESLTINKVYSRHRQELDSDGVVSYSATELLDAFDNLYKTSKKCHGFMSVDGAKLSYSPNLLYPKRAVLRIGMLLTESKVAQEIRTLLLDHYDGINRDLLQYIAKSTEIEINKEWYSTDKVYYKINNVGQMYRKLNNGEWILDNDNLPRLIIRDLKPIWRPEKGETYYLPDITTDYMYKRATWRGTRHENTLYFKELVFKDREKAIIKAEELLKEE